MILLFFFFAISAVSASDDNLTCGDMLMDYQHSSLAGDLENNSNQVGIEVENHAKNENGINEAQHSIKLSAKNIKSTYGKKVTFSVKVSNGNVL